MGLTRALLLRPQRPRQVLRTVVIYALAITVMAVFLAPIVWLFISSITPLPQLLTVPLKWLPEHPTFEHYNRILTASRNAETTASNFKVAIGNSILVAGSVTLVCLFVGSLAAYAFARLDVPLGDKLIFLLLFTQMIPGIAIMIPLYLIASRLNMLDRRITLVIIYCSFSLPFVIWMMRGYFQTIPRELEDAAMIDGCSRVGALFRVVIPLSKPGLFATGIFAFLGAWNEFLMALVMTQSLASKTMPVAMAEFIGRFRVDYGLMCTVGVIACVPPILFALVFQRYLIEGLTAGAVKA
jgi:multiple sugar transport system permease protein